MTLDHPMLERVRKLLSLATSPNVHEAASAAALAQTLIARHRLDAWIAAEQATAEDPDPITDGRDAPLEVGRRIRTWRVVLASALADVNGCVAYTADLGAERAIVLLGRSRDRAAVAELWTFLVKRIEWLSATHGAGQPRAWHDAFRVGAVQTIAERLAQVGAEVRAELSEAALVRLDPAVLAHQAALERFMADKLRLGKGRGVRVDPGAFEQGRAAGGEVDLGVSTSAGKGVRRR